MAGAAGCGSFFHRLLLPALQPLPSIWLLLPFREGLCACDADILCQLARTMREPV